MGREGNCAPGALRGGGDLLVVTEIVRMECLVGPIKAGDTALLAEFAAFFAAPGVVIQPITGPVALRGDDPRQLQVSAHGLPAPCSRGRARLPRVSDQ